MVDLVDFGDHNSTFSEYGHVAYQMKGYEACTNMVAMTPSSDPGDWVKSSKLNFFSTHGCVAYQSKGNGECSNIQAHILSSHVLSTPGVGSKVKTFFLKLVMLHIKLIRMEHRAS